MDLSSTHLHLLLNHFPTIGFIIGFGLLVFGVIVKSDHLKVASLVTMVGIALLTIPVYATGSAAELRICGDLAARGPCDDEAVSRRLIEMHEGAAFVSLYAMELAGGLAWLGLWQYRRRRQIPTWNIVLVLLASVLTLATVTRAATIGGEIRHPEIRVTVESPEEPIGRVLGTFIATTPWTWASAEAIHMVGLTLVIGIVLLVDLKMLGFLPAIPYRTVDRLLPWAILGFATNVMTGMLFFVATPYQYVGNPAFDRKLVFLLAAGLNMLLFTFDGAWTREGQPAPGYSKALAVTALALWVGVMFWGTMLPYIGQAF